ncbi:MAG: hypothetical protein ABI809_00345 [Caldimonas sp.]
MSTGAFSPSRWSVDAIDPAGPAASGIASRTPGSRAADAAAGFAAPSIGQRLGALLGRVWPRVESTRADDILQVANRVEHEMPNLAAELRYIAGRCPAPHR